MMPTTRCHDKKSTLKFSLLALLFLFVTVFAFSSLSASAAAVKQKGFGTPDDAAQALVKELKANNRKELLAIFGPGGKGLAASGDPVADRADIEKFIEAFDESHSIKMRSPEVAILLVGSQDFPFPIPLVKEGDAWVFDTKTGREEIINRRIGRNELGSIEVLRAYVDAQREFFEMKSDEEAKREYAQKLFSSKGMHDGLYWEAKEGDEESPMGPFVASAAEEGYVRKANRRIPYHGYYYRILTGQGSHAAGGAKQYIVNGKMTEGFAMVAHPAKYGSSGIMTFMVNQDGTIYQKDLGKRTGAIVKAIKSFDPDVTWRPVQE
ncbi:MAG: DUF2950 domain-containing protein [Geobacteraceae bacterium]|nr:DUF2950 domain-containing protein [Geobacteraceae bacterium]